MWVEVWNGSCLSEGTMRSAPLAALASAAFLLVACSADSASDDLDDSEGKVIAGGTHEMQASPSDRCQAELIFLQKDAYKSTPGHANDFWPAHTTTVLQVTCQTKNGPQTITPFEENHGTKPGTKDPVSGKDMLDKMPVDSKLVTAEATWRDMQKLVASYGDCECQPDTFFSLDKVDAEAAGVVQNLMPILTCPDAPEVLLGALKEKRFDDVKAMLTKCRIKEGTTPAELAKAAAGVDAEVKKAFAGKHVCNNDAQLQADLFTHFRETKEAKVCDPLDKTYCQSPTLFYRPAKETK
jgi:hypothetical protein